ncbi:hypothetical protein A9993_03415 [Rahnella victoriana]|nr:MULTISPECIES: helix-turn-helix transcriptional regulator [Rahnella]PBI78829.1 hypothetical protein A9993_03415 [Rahnella victoriana]
MHLSSKQHRALSKILALQSTATHPDTLRENIGPLILDVLNADTYSSLVWSEQKGVFEKAIGVNETVDRLNAWNHYFRHIDPITLPLMRRKSATAATQILHQRELMRTEFYNDFLRPQHQHWGINVYFFHEGQCVGDFRIWRKRERGDFVKNDADILNLLAASMPATLHRLNRMKDPAPEDFLRAPQTTEEVLQRVMQLSRREAEIACLVAEGLADKNISAQLGIGVTTVRYHMGNIFEKCKARNRSMVAARIKTIGAS